MRILVTGNMGYIGPCVVEHLRDSRPEAELIGLDTGFFAQCLTGTTLLPERRLDCQYFGDVRAVPVGALQGVDGVVHLAGVSNDPIGTSFEAATLDVNHRATVSLARAAKEAGAGSFVFASSCSVYGLAEDGLRTEESETGPLTAYATSKLLAEQDLAKLADVKYEGRKAIVCLVGENLRETPGIAARVFGELADVKIRMISQGASEINLTFVIDEDAVPEVVRRLHRTFFSELDPEVFA